MDYNSAASSARYQQLMRIEAGRKALERSRDGTKQTRHDGYVNMLTKYGTTQDNSTAYGYVPEGMVSDQMLVDLYEGGGLFAKIIDAPAEVAVEKGFDLGITDEDAKEYIDDSLAWLEWDENIATAIKWARLFGGSLAVMMIDDGGSLEDPLEWDRIKGIDEIRVYDRSIVQPDYSSLYRLDPGTEPGGRRTRPRFCQPLLSAGALSTWVCHPYWQCGR